MFTNQVKYTNYYNVRASENNEKDNNYNKFEKFDNYESLDNLNPIVRAQQYGFNGRIFLDPNTNTKIKPYELYQDSSQIQNTNVNIISNVIVPNTLSRQFFSNDNVEVLQQNIIREVFRVSNKQIGKQSYQDLQIIMKSMYLQYGRNLQHNIEEQIIVLNKYVIDECVRIIVPNVLQYNKYVSEINSPIPNMPRAQNMSNKGDKYGDFSSLIPS